MTAVPKKLERYAVPSADEVQALPAKLDRERQWYGDATRFQTVDDVMTAQADGRLAPIPDNPDIRPVNGFFRSDVVGTYALLAPRALNAALLIARLWRGELGRQGIDDPRLRLPLSSMTRTQQYQDEIVAQGRLAASDSTHQTGNAFDIDMSAYTIMTENPAVPIVNPERHAGGSREAEFAAHRQRFGDYDPAINDALRPVLEGFHAAGIINRIYEFAGTSNSTVHIAVSPVFVK